MESPDLLLIPTTSKSVIVCKKFLKNSKTLKKAQILKELFGLNEKDKATALLFQSCLLFQPFTTLREI